MTYAVVKEKLHSYIESADQKKIKAIYALVEDEIHQENFVYDEAILKALEKISDDAFSGKTKTLTVRQSMDNIKSLRRKNGV
jgi:hypothetical protein